MPRRKASSSSGSPHPAAFEGDPVTAVRVQRMRLGPADASGRRAPEPDPAAPERLAADLVIKALGFDPEELPRLFGAPDLAVTRWGTLRCDHKTMMTNLPGVFAAGDIVRGASLVVWAIRDGRDVAKAMHALSRGDGGGREGRGMTVSAAERARVAEHGMYRPDLESDACGVGLIAATDGVPSRRVVTAAIDALKAVWHRGAVDADGKTGDGAGIHVELPRDFFDEHIARAGHAPKANRLAVGMIFLPRADLAAQETCRTIVEAEIIGFGYTIYGWRQVPVDTSVIGTKAAASRPEIEQIMIAGPLPAAAGDDMPGEAGGADVDAFEKDLYLIRRRIEKAVVAAQIQGFYICSLSARSIIYKGLFLAEELSVFYPDLTDERFKSRFAIYHQRYSTNTFPQWWLAQPFRCLAHNGEINTVRGNKNWMKSHEIRMAAAAFGEHSADIKPLIPAGASDTAALDAVFEAFVRSGRDAPTAKLMLIPEAWSRVHVMPEKHRAMYAFFASIMEAWDGPAALAMTDGRWVLAGVDRSALRPMRWLTTTDGLLITGSEAGMVVVPETTITAKGALGPGQMIAVDLDGDGGEGARLYRDGEVKDRIAAAQPYGEWVEHFRTFAALPGHDAPQPAAAYDRSELRRRQVAAGLTAEDMELLLAPMVEDAKEAVGSMGDDTPLGRHLVAAALDQPLLPPELQSGDEPADRLAARDAGDEPEDALRQLRQHPRPRRAAGRGDGPRLAGPDQPRLGRAEGALRPRRGDDRLHVRHRRRARGAAGGDRARPRGGRDRRALGQEPAVPDRREPGRAPRRHHHDPGRRGRAHAPRRQGAALVLEHQRALGRVPRPALFRRADRGRGHDGQRLSGAGGDRATATPAACSASAASTSASRATRRRSTTACSRSWARWASPSSARTAAATTSRRWGCRARWSTSSSPVCRPRSAARGSPRST